MRFAWLLLVLGCHGGRFDRDRFEGVVARVRSVVTAPGQVYRFRLNTALEPSSLTPMAPNALLGRGDGRGVVRAAVDAQHHLAVSIETRDDGHAGEHGFMYVDDGFARGDLEGVQLDSQQEQRVDPRWVRWTYDLD